MKYVDCIFLIPVLLLHFLLLSSSFLKTDIWFFRIWSSSGLVHLHFHQAKMASNRCQQFSYDLRMIFTCLLLTPVFLGSLYCFKGKKQINWYLCMLMISRNFFLEHICLLLYVENEEESNLLKGAKEKDTKLSVFYFLLC